jgi:hypothetical protein
MRGSANHYPHRLHPFGPFDPGVMEKGAYTINAGSCGAVPSSKMQLLHLKSAFHQSVFQPPRMYAAWMCVTACCSQALWNAAFDAGLVSFADDGGLLTAASLRAVARSAGCEPRIGPRDVL